MMSAVAGRSGKYPFTASQWQELEQQAMIYKYMVAGMPIPPDLLFTIKRNLDCSLSSKLFPYQTSSIGWNPYQMGFGGKKIDPEPGRCRRTDGKKWRCSKEAYPDSKYCERHMHRGKNRSRKPVEEMATQTPTTSVFNQTAAAPNNKTSNTSSHQPVGHHNQHHASFFDSQFPYPHSSSSRPAANIDLSGQNIDSSSLRESEHAFFTDHKSESQAGYPYLALKTDITKQEKQNQQLDIWGRDFSSSETEKDQTQKTTHHFIDEWSSKAGRDPSSLWHDASTTQLSISMPSSQSSYDFFRAYNEG